MTEALKMKKLHRSGVQSLACAPYLVNKPSVKKIVSFKIVNVQTMYIFLNTSFTKSATEL